MQITANGTHHHLARVQPHPDLHIEPLLSPQFLGIPADGLLHVQGGIARPYRMVLMGQRCPEQRHDAVAHDLVDRTLIAVHSSHEALQHGVEEPSRLFRVAVGQQLHGPLQVGKQHRDLLTFAFQGAAGGEDLLREVGRRIRVRSREAGQGGGLRVDRLAALEAKFRARRQRRAALGAHQHKVDATLQTKLRLGRVLLLALRTLHTVSSLFACIGHLCSNTCGQHIRAGLDGQDGPWRSWPSTPSVDKNVPAVYHAAILGSMGATPSSAIYPF